MQNAIKLENMSNLIAPPCSYPCRKTTVSMKVLVDLVIHALLTYISKYKLDFSYQNRNNSWKPYLGIIYVSNIDKYNASPC